MKATTLLAVCICRQQIRVQVHWSIKPCSTQCHWYCYEAQVTIIKFKNREFALVRMCTTVCDPNFGQTSIRIVIIMVMTQLIRALSTGGNPPHPPLTNSVKSQSMKSSLDTSCGRGETNQLWLHVLLSI